MSGVRLLQDGKTNKERERNGSERVRRVSIGLTFLKPVNPLNPHEPNRTDLPCTSNWIPFSFFSFTFGRSAPCLPNVEVFFMNQPLLLLFLHLNILSLSRFNMTKLFVMCVLKVFKCVCRTSFFWIGSGEFAILTSQMFLFLGREHKNVSITVAIWPFMKLFARK